MKRFSFKPAQMVLAVAGILLCTVGSAQSNRNATPPPPLPAKSPVDSFRALLVMPTAERRQFIATRDTNVQQRLVQKIREYQSLPPEERDLRLKATELRWFLQPLMHAPATNRPAQLALIPESMRTMVADRLQQWDRIPAPVQQMFLTNQQAVNYLARVDATTNSAPWPPLPSQEKIIDRVNQLFDLTPNEKEDVMATLSDAERQQMEKTLEAFKKLTPAQRRQCLLSFKQFTEMSPAERQEFLNNAKRWSQMPPAQRQAWREVVSTAPNVPPAPLITVPSPPLPLNSKPRPSVATNGGG
ncbi:MAG TPA: DUF3106 domain-containing protein [Verrucomicrobiae bacterium]|nr:DUF3106 domain-containing protein [Verrucomicrobiae bacterium]